MWAATSLVYWVHFVADPIYTLYLKAYCMYSLKEAKNAAGVSPPILGALKPVTGRSLLRLHN